MGILQQMVHLLNKLDPENKQWKALLTKQTKKDAADAIDEESSEDREEALDDVKKSFDSKLTNPDYARKLYLIENCIFGIDIQSIAIQISKLRFFISLVVDQIPNDKPEDNFGIRPLPNLEAKFIAADSLIALKKNDTPSLFPNEDKEFIKLQERLKKSIHRIFLTKRCNAKHRHQEKVKTLHKEIAKQLKERKIVSAPVANNIANWDMFDQNAVAPFFDPEWMFGVSDGFDIVLGNPPYRQLQANKAELGNKYQPCNFETFASAGDVYCLFYEKSLNLLKQNGCFCLITSNKWMSAGYGEKLRDYLSRKAYPRLLIDFSGFKVFQDATVDPNILLCEKSENAQMTLCTGIKKEFDRNSINHLSDYVVKNRIPMNFKNVGGNSWVVLSSIEQSIKKKIESAGVPLKDWDIQINYGVKTGNNDAFIISEEKREEILGNCKTPAERKRTNQLIKPILRGRDIKRYSYDWAGLYLIALFPSKEYDIDDYPAVKKHLLEFDKERLIDCGLDDIADKKTVLHDFCRQRLEQTGEDIRINGRKVIINGKVQKSRKKTNNKWFETQDSISYWEDFFKSKIVYGQFQESAEYSFAESGVFLSSNEYMLITHNYSPKCLLAFLNSKISEWLLGNVTGNLGGNAKIGQKSNFLKLPVAILSKSEQKVFDKYVDIILQRKSENASTKEVEQEVDQRIYQIYGLTPEEIAFIEKSDN